ncbi:MAG: head-tail connector protein [Phycisphaerales bacterium]|nr:head-tail connector protein [Phycisphaerales bacterium]
MGLSQITPPDGEPLALNDAKLYLRVDNPDEDALVSALITAARERAEQFTQRQLMTATWLFTTGDNLHRQATAYDPVTNRITLPKPPLQSVVSVGFVDSNGVLNPMDPSEYRVSVGEEPGFITLNTIPAYDTNRDDAFQIQFVAGYGDASAVPQGIVTAMKWMIGEAYGTRTESEAAQNSSIERLLGIYRVWKW